MEELILPVGFSSSSGVKTYFVFTHIPRHLELSVGYLPILIEGTQVDFDLKMRNPRKPDSVRDISGPFVISRQSLRWSNQVPSRSGLVQYVEWKPASKDSSRIDR